MSGLVHQFDDDVIRLHLARLALLDADGYRRVRVNIGEYMVGETQDRLDAQRLVDGSAMPTSAAALARKGGKGKTLKDKLHLYKSYVYQLTATALEVGSGLIYAAIHHFGGDTGRGHRTHIIPRPVLGTNEQDEQVIGDYLIDAIRKLQ